MHSIEDPTRVMIVSQWGKTKQAEIKKDTQVRRLAGVKSPVLRRSESRRESHGSGETR